MIAVLIAWIFYILIFAVVTAGLYWICKKFEFPQPVLWLVGGVLLIFILLFLSGQVNLPVDLRFHN